MFWGLVVKLLEGLGLGWLTHKTDVTKEAGADEQIIKDKEAGDAITRAGVDAASDADHSRVLREDQPASAPSRPDPDLPYRD